MYRSHFATDLGRWDAGDFFVSDGRSDAQSMRSRSSSSCRRLEDERCRRSHHVISVRDGMQPSSSFRDLRRSRSTAMCRHPAPRPWYSWQPPAGQSTFEHDRPGTARHFLVTGDFTGTWRDGWNHGVAMDGFYRNSGFTRRNFFDTARQSHLPDLRQLGATSPNRVTRIN
mmetsp:Transcript_1664/g.3481  ORF Transcript_1664/g.3481 Transcript_1664/m.3481 type:complete len:170 (+) Transcript_1664:64-573(+)